MDSDEEQVMLIQLERLIAPMIVIMLEEIGLLERCLEAISEAIWLHEGDDKCERY